MERYDSREDLQPEDHSYSLHCYQSQDSSPVQELSWDGEYLCVTHEGSSGIICYREGLSCITCKSSRCRHINLLSEVAEKYNIDLPENALKIMNPKKLTTSPWVKVVSWRGIPFRLGDNLQAVYAKPVSERIPGGVLVESKSNSTCKICGSMWSNNVSNIKSLPLIDKKITTMVEVGERKCSNISCCTISKYDGQEHCIFHTSHTLIAYEVLFEFMDLFTRNRTTLYTYFMSLKDNHKRSGDSKFHHLFSYAHFKFAWYGFLQKVCSTIAFEEGFTCLQCGSSPDHIIMDATTLAHRKDFKLWSENLKRLTSEKISDIPYSYHRDRVLINDPYTRLLLKRYAGDQPPLTDQEFTKMTELIGFHNSQLQSLIRSFGLSTAAPHPYRDLLRNLALDSPICGMFHPGMAIRRTLEDMQRRDPRSSPDILEELQVQLPMIFKLVSSLEEIPKLLTDLLQSLLDLAESSYPPSSQLLDSCSPDTSQFRDSFFPALSPIRSRGIYDMDMKHGKKEQQECTKRSKGHPSLLPGVFCLFCEHGICYGYELMDSHESPNVPFTLLLTRFKKAPSIVIYDNACKLHTYCLNRYPDFFKDSWFLVDRLHWFNHRGCNSGYNLNDYPQFKSLNSQAAEQGNSSLGKLKSMLSYMTNENFHLHCKFYLWVLNYRKQKLD